MLPTVWQALILKPTLAHLTVRFSSLRHPRPITFVSPMPNLKSLKIYDIDPLSYADDLSLLFLGAKKLEDLKLIWSPRMREAREPSVSLNTFFGKLAASDHRLPLKRLAIKNLYAPHNDICGSMILSDATEEITFINSVAGSGDDTDTVFVDRQWRSHDVDSRPNLKMLRMDKVSRKLLEFLGTLNGLERLYLVGSHITARAQSNNTNTASSTDPTPLPNSPPSSTDSPTSDSMIRGLKDEYLDIITKKHGKTLRHLLLLPSWRLSSDDVARVIRQCPNLEQLGIGVEFTELLNVRLLVPFLSKLTTIRILGNPDDPAFLQKMKELDDDGSHEQKLRDDSQILEWKVRWIGLGTLLYELGKPVLQAASKDRRKEVYKRSVKKRPFEAAKHIEIFGLDSLEIL